MTAPPVEPVGVRMHTRDGDELAPDRMIYLGPDPECGCHAFEAWFPPEMDYVHLTVERLPAKTELHVRFGDPEVDA